MSELDFFCKVAGIALQHPTHILQDVEAEIWLIQKLGVNIITFSNIKRLVAVAFTVITGTIAVQANTPAHAIAETSDAKHHVAAPKTDESLSETAKENNIRLTKPVKVTGATLEKQQVIKITPGTNNIHEAANLLKAEAEAKAKKEAAAKAAKAKAEAKAKQEAAAKAAKEAKAKAAAKAAAASRATTTSASTSSSSKASGRTHYGIKITFYDPAVLGSSMGYSGVAANLNVFPRGTRLKISMSNGTVLYRTVNDTGSFAASNSHQLDVAMPNNQIPSAGVLSATVEVL